MKTLAVVNPASSNGRTARRWPGIRTLLEEVTGPVDEVFTTGPGEGEALAARGLAEGYEAIVSVGGDGTHSEVVNGFFHHGEATDRCFIPITSGTGGDFRKTFGVDAGPEAAIAHLRRCEPRPLDVGEYAFIDRQGRPGRRRFLNILSLGMGGLVDEKVNSTSKAFGGKVSFFLGSLRAMLAYRNVRIRLTLDGGETLERTTVVTALANGRFFGGGMKIAPDADPRDGLLDVVILGDLSKTGMMGLSGAIYRGEHLSHPRVEVCRARRVVVESDDDALLDVDGEPLGRCPIDVTVLPAALRAWV
ncbi:MAG: diacylglycerol kinase family lipid kinase [Deltaproteobacteria bacterium]|nr:diacylglycerol kinase family lipid kinase [Deltaproteobacteria bacterium]